jgi:hypothetical protein
MLRPYDQEREKGWVKKKFSRNMSGYQVSGHKLVKVVPYKFLHGCPAYAARWWLLWRRIGRLAQKNESNVLARRAGPENESKRMPSSAPVSAGEILRIANKYLMA